MPVGYSEHWLVLLSTVLIPMRTAKSYPCVPLPWYILRAPHCFTQPPAALLPLPCSTLLCRAAPSASKSFWAGVCLLTAPDVLAQPRCSGKQKQSCECSKAAAPLVLCQHRQWCVLLCHTVGQQDCSPQTKWALWSALFHLSCSFIASPALHNRGHKSTGTCQKCTSYSFHNWLKELSF